jgi:hypothetical protein
MVIGLQVKSIENFQLQIFNLKFALPSSLSFRKKLPRRSKQLSKQKISPLENQFKANTVHLSKKAEVC